MSIRIGVLSDTHLRSVTRALNDILDEYLADVDVLFHAGDFTSSEVVEFLNQRVFYGVAGNMDPLEVKILLPEKTIVELAGYRFGLIHGWGPSEGLEERVFDQFQGVDAIVYGHSHRPANHVKEGILLFNPGTTTGFVSAGSHTIGVLECGDALRGHIIDIE